MAANVIITFFSKLQGKPYMLLSYLMVDGIEVVFLMLITIFGTEILDVLVFKTTFWLFLVFLLIVTGTNL